MNDYKLIQEKNSFWAVRKNDRTIHISYSRESCINLIVELKKREEINKGRLGELTL